MLIQGLESWSIFKVASILLFVQDHGEGMTWDVNWTQPHVSSLWTWPVNLFCLFSPFSQGCPSFKHVLQWEKLRPVLRERDKNSELTCSLAAMWWCDVTWCHMMSHVTWQSHDLWYYMTCSYIMLLLCARSLVSAFVANYLSREKDEELHFQNSNIP